MTRVLMGGEIIIDIPQTFGDYQFVQMLGQGSFSVVVKVRHRTTGFFYACKVISQQFLIDNQIVQSFEREVSVMSKLTHPNIIKFHQMMSDDRLIYLIMDYCSRGDLHKFISEHGALDESFAVLYTKQILSAVEYFHSNNIVHRDLKPENIFMDSDMSIKIGDFGLSNEFKPDSLMSTQCGSPIYAAPEIISSRPYNGKLTDMWSVGVILYVMLTGRIPWENVTNNSQLFYQIQTARYHIPSTVSEKATNLINSLMQPQPEMRITADEALNHPWLMGSPSKSRSQPSSTILASKLSQPSIIQPRVHTNVLGTYRKPKELTPLAPSVLIRHRMPITEREGF